MAKQTEGRRLGCRAIFRPHLASSLVDWLVVRFKGLNRCGMRCLWGTTEHVFHSYI
jgi:hypothetical protein